MSSSTSPKIDGHTHAWLPEDLQTLEERLIQWDRTLDASNPHKWLLRFNGSLDGLVEAEKAVGMDQFVLLAVSGRPERSRELTRWVSEAARLHPEVIPFGAVHPHSSTLEDDVAAIVDLGIPAVKVHSLVQRFDPLSPPALKLFGLLEKNGLPVLMDAMNLAGACRAKPHLEGLLGMARQFGLQTGPAQIAELSRRFEGLKIIAAHLGCLYGWDELDGLYDLPMVWFDLAYVHRLMSAERAMEIIRLKGTDRIIYGSDAPWRSPAGALAWFMNLPLAEEERAAILGTNLLDVLGRPV